MSQESKEKLKAAAEREFVNRLRRENLSQSEIQTKLEKFSATLKARPLDYEAYAKMPYAEKSFHEFANSVSVDKALQEHQDERKQAEEKVKNGVERMWKGSASTDESEQAWETADKFMALYPAVRPTDTATGAIFRKYLRANNLDPRDLSSWEAALQALGSQNQPEIVLSPKAAGVGPEEELGGYQLRSYPNLHLLLRRAPDEATRKFRESYRPELSADEFKKQHLQETDAPHYVKAPIHKACDTLIAWHPDYVNTDDNIKLLIDWIAENGMQYDINGFEAGYHGLSKEHKLERRADAIIHAGEMTMTNYSGERNQAPALPDKASLAAKIRNLSSTELAEFFRNNKGARKAVDAM